ncbi:MAG: hypothetical protein HYZ14_02280 [Bacteroidetes bacterium]|nr:hypothetical protein [Bacteroidota bacterium]
MTSPGGYLQGKRATPYSVLLDVKSGFIYPAADGFLSGLHRETINQVIGIIEHNTTSKHKSK